MWTAKADAHVLRVRVRSSDHDGAEVAHWVRAVVVGAHCTHVQLHPPDGVMRLDVVGDVDLGGIMTIEPILDLDRAIEPQVATIRRLVALRRGAPLPRADQRMVRLVEALRAVDALAAGASLRDIGLGIFGGEWPGDGEHLKSKVRRRIALGADVLRAGAPNVLQERI